MFGFKRAKDPDLKPLSRGEGLKIVRENHHLRDKNESLVKEMVIMREEMRRLEFMVKEYQQMLFKKKALKYKKDAHDDNDDMPKKKGAPVGHEGTTRKIPDRVDEHKDVRIDKCPECSSDKLTPAINITITIRKI